MSVKKSQTEVGGLVGEELTVRKMKHRMVVKNRPKWKVEAPSEKQEGIQQKFKEALRYAKRQTANEESLALYETGITKKLVSAHVVAMRDFLNPPTVHEIDTVDYRGNVGNPILVNATDDFMVKGVKIAITDSGGNVLEEGEALFDEERNRWKYAATVANPSLAGTIIQATAIDRPGNKATLDKVLL